MIKPSSVRVLTGVVVLAVIGILALSASAWSALARVVVVQPESTPAWMPRIALVDEALGRADLSRAIFEWRQAYGAALESGRSGGLVAVADRASRIAQLGGGAGGRTEAGDIYVHAALRARAERSRDAVLGIVERLQRLGDPERAEQVRRLARR